ncbi:glycosyltransferase family protein [Marinitenerispora sediminis]|uniref:UDP-N-acetylglucosamine--LPS N-acetylglucosamine transferase n=1 Tax=Marinitenerispora sediminis TaxID=1931232 RepID=A0A368T7Y7_9ACTN|nr:UDP-N-acetylglucosamine--LPS N-acetylglucosamine transferase [Marinitenerispora sediminis]RCV56030.1 UDP-N-acetylglucosamine--LPS N-acetylglucosamine transferase [Marinitenerispora sediminis]RCV60240.1 UDP-N-acetylglucosamine--LPS N-acetylglucosamine transferase [Marinitenerispora sediminis]RCV60982.1 UDP-N-acetylglucosamine--LPS N-acetylglucosamine transferase [Marinitenerispora sediminis]
MPAAPVLFVASSGGHLAQLWSLRPWWEGRDRLWVTFRTPDAVSTLAGERVRWAHHPTTRHLGNLLRNTVLAVRVLAGRRPAVVVSTGAGVALPFFAVAWLLRVPTVYIEVYDRIDAPTLTARLCRPFTRLFLAQWEEQRDFMPTAITVGPLL